MILSTRNFAEIAHYYFTHDSPHRVVSESRPWKLGQAMIFDDRYQHEASNRTDNERVVLLIDFVPEETGKQAK